MIDFPHIPESQFLDHNRIQIQRLAQDLKATGLSINRISELTRMNWDTVWKAMNGRPVRFDNAERLRYFVKWWSENQGAAPENRQTKPDVAPETKGELRNNSATTSQPFTPPRGQDGRFLPKNPKQ